MQKKLDGRIALALYVVAIIIYALFRLKGDNEMALISQPFILISLGLFYIANSKKTNFFYLFALIFSLLGSLFFINATLEKFMIGMALIFIANKFFLLLTIHRIKFFKLTDVLFISALIYVILILLVYLFYDVSLALKTIVIIYSFSLALLLAFAVIHLRKTRDTPAKLMLIGIIFLIGRDYFTGLSRLLELFDYHNFIIPMISHSAAMYLICKSVLSQENKKRIMEI